MSTKYFHFTLGPVQGFVSQARRTRDFWTGSFILSWLAAVAMKATEEQGGKIKFPSPDPEFLKWVVDDKDKDLKVPPKQGSIPNRFKAEVSDGFKPKLVTDAVQSAWLVLADKIWEHDLKYLGEGSKHYTIWKRQIEYFWDMAWVITDDNEDSSALDRRKNWRTYIPSEEPGVKCAMMDGWQELSGESSPNRDDMEKFWKPLRDNGRWGMKSDLRKNEALCAIAFIKRRFSRHFEFVNHKFVAEPEQGFKRAWRIQGWHIPSNVPSVTYMAAVHWLRQLLQEPAPDKASLENFHTLAYELTGKEYSEIHTDIKCLVTFKKNPLFKKILSLDGNVFFETELENPRIFAKEDAAKTQLMQDTLEALQAVKHNAKEQKTKVNQRLEPLTPFYAILLMDGDSLGEKMSKERFQYSITKGLEEFTAPQGVPKIVHDHNGFLIYAGGDDVLAILPLEDAIPCAVALRQHYMHCFKPKPAANQNEARIAVDTTISAAIEFVHIKTPLTKVLKDSHELLDKVAKSGSGRDALAIRVWKPGGLQIEWSQPWNIVLGDPQCLTYSLGEAHSNSSFDIENSTAVVCQLAESFKNNTQVDKEFSNKFFYKIRERFDLLNPAVDQDGNDIEPLVLDKRQATSFMTMEYLNSWSNEKNKDMKGSRAAVQELLGQCRPVKRKLNKTNHSSQVLPFNQWEYSNHIKVSAALLVRFLAQKGMEKS